MGRRNTDISKRIRRLDWYVGICFAMMLLVKFFTIFTFVLVTEESGAVINAVATNYEANPLFMLGIQLQNIGYIITVIILPAIAVATYLYFRRRVLHNKYPIDTLEFMIMFVFFSLLINIVNDGSGLMAKLWRLY